MSDKLFRRYVRMKNYHIVCPLIAHTETRGNLNLKHLSWFLLILDSVMPRRRYALKCECKDSFFHGPRTSM